MATLTDAQKHLIRLYTDDPAGDSQVVKDSTLQTLWDELDSPSVEALSAKIWRIKAATVTDWYLVNIDGSFLSRNQVFDHCIAMAEFYENKSGTTFAMTNVGLTGPNAVDTESSSEF